MTQFGRRAHERTNANGTTFWVRGHIVRREDWNRSGAAADLRKSDAIAILHRNLARTISGCYVTPNARCPVCREPVFFYANRFGSRVFFDELGPSWAKHPCTDNPRKPVGAQLEFKQPIVRKRGERLELLENARIAGYDEKLFYGEGNDRSHLLVVNSVLREGSTNLVVCECITAHPATTVQFKCLSKDPIFDIGDFVSKRGIYFSYLHRDSMKIVNFRSGEEISLAGSVLSNGQTARSVGLGSEPPKSTLIKRYYPLDRLSETERRHFQTEKISVGELCGRLWSVVRRMPGKKGPKPEQLANYLNKSRYRTACGEPWTPSLAAVLLQLLAANKLLRRPSIKRNKGSQPQLRKRTANRSKSLPSAKHPAAELTDLFENLAQAIISKE